MIDLAQYLVRQVEYGDLLSVQMRADAGRTVDLVNSLMCEAESAGVVFQVSPRTGSNLTSGWRPPAVNAATAGAAKNSLHLRCLAADVYDPGDLFDAWLISGAGQAAMARIGLWHEHPSATPGWAHVQTLPPPSGRRTFYPA